MLISRNVLTVSLHGAEMQNLSSGHQQRREHWQWTVRSCLLWGDKKPRLLNGAVTYRGVTVFLGARPHVHLGQNDWDVR